MVLMLLYLSLGLRGRLMLMSPLLFSPGSWTMLPGSWLQAAGSASGSWLTDVVSSLFVSFAALGSWIFG